MSLRTFPDRVRHAISFEVLGVAIFIPLASYVFHFSASHMGVVGIGSATIATLWNFVFNLGFDRVMYRMAGHANKTLGLRVLHVVIFEAGLMALLIPLISWYLGIGLWETLMMDLSIVVFYMVYAFFFNLAYDRVFPVKPRASRYA